MAKENADAAYDRFAGVYDRHWGEEVPAEIMTIIDRIFVPRMPRGARILDVCCGTGYTAAELGRRGFSVTGLDVSEEMLRHARRNAQGARLILADARRFALPPIYHGIVSTFDSLNHIMSVEELLAVFNNIHRALAPGGLFLFDMNMEKGFLEHWADYFAIIEESEVCILTGVYDVARRTGRYDITMFERRGKLWRRTDTTISEKYYPAKEIKRTLRSAGFKSVSTYDAEHELGLADHVGRTFFLARKSSAR